MTFLEAIKACLTKYAVFSGRATRSEFWWFVLFWWLLNLVTMGLDHWFFDAPLVATTEFTDPVNGLTVFYELGGGALNNISYLVLLIPSLAAGARRLHDRGYSGWMQLLWLVPIAGWIVLVVLFVRRGQGTINQYGPPANATAAPMTGSSE